MIVIHEHTRIGGALALTPAAPLGPPTRTALIRAITEMGATNSAETDLRVRTAAALENVALAQVGPAHTRVKITIDIERDGEITLGANPWLDDLPSEARLIAGPGTDWAIPPPLGPHCGAATGARPSGALAQAAWLRAEARHGPAVGTGPNRIAWTATRAGPRWRVHTSVRRLTRTITRHDAPEACLNRATAAAVRRAEPASEHQGVAKPSARRPHPPRGLAGDPHWVRAWAIARRIGPSSTFEDAHSIAECAGATGRRHRCHAALWLAREGTTLVCVITE